MAGRFKDPTKRLEERTERVGECLVWTRPLPPGHTYPQMSIEGSPARVHRWVYEVNHGPIPEGMHVDHSCHNQLCLEPSHLRLATPQENGRNRRGRRAGRIRDLPRNVYEKRPGQYFVSFMVRRKARHFGTFRSAEEAAAVAERARKELWGDFAGEGGE